MSKKRLTLRQRQSKFAFMVAQLIMFAYAKGYEVTLGAAFVNKDWESPHLKEGKHPLKLAIDLNLFNNGRYLRTTKEHLPLGEFWESIGGTWGGRFSKPDGNHYEF